LLELRTRQAGTNALVPLAAGAEMLDRTHHDRWEPDLDAVLDSS
jgi:hypothetical protein